MIGQFLVKTKALCHTCHTFTVATLYIVGQKSPWIRLRRHKERDRYIVSQTTICRRGHVYRVIGHETSRGHPYYVIEHETSPWTPILRHRARDVTVDTRITHRAPGVAVDAYSSLCTTRFHLQTLLVCIVVMDCWMCLLDVFVLFLTVLFVVGA